MNELYHFEIRSFYIDFCQGLNFNYYVSLVHVYSAQWSHPTGSCCMKTAHFDAFPSSLLCLLVSFALAEDLSSHFLFFYLLICSSLMFWISHKRNNMRIKFCVWFISFTVWSQRASNFILMTRLSFYVTK